MPCKTPAYDVQETGYGTEGAVAFILSFSQLHACTLEWLHERIREAKAAECIKRTLGENQATIGSRS